MKRSPYIMVTVLVVLLMLSVWTAFAQTPKIPITYEGDTDETIARRAQWIEKVEEEKEILVEKR